MKPTARILSFKGLDLRSTENIKAAEAALMADLINRDVTLAESRKIQKELTQRINGFAAALKTFPHLEGLNKLVNKLEPAADATQKKGVEKGLVETGEIDSRPESLPISTSVVKRVAQNGKKGNGSVFQRGAVYWVKYYRNGKAYRESSGSTKEIDARKLLRKRHGEMALGRFAGPDADKVTIRELAADYVTDYRVNGKKSLSKALRMVTRHDDEGKAKDSPLMVYFGDCKAHEVGTDLIKRYVAMRQEQGAASATINRELSAIKRMFNLGIQAEKIFRKPYIPMLQEHNVRQGFFERAEFLAFRAALPDYLKPVVTFAYSTGWRRGEISGLKWHQVDLENKSLRIERESTKNKKARTIALDGELLEAIQGQWDKRKVAAIPGESPALLCPYVFHRNGKPIGDFRFAWDKALKETGLSGKILHDFRRTAVRNMVRSGVNENLAMKISGHKTRSVFDRYDIVDEDDLRDAARKVWEYAQNQEAAAKVVALRSNQ